MKPLIQRAVTQSHIQNIHTIIWNLDFSLLDGWTNVRWLLKNVCEIHVNCCWVKRSQIGWQLKENNFEEIKFKVSLCVRLFLMRAVCITHVSTTLIYTRLDEEKRNFSLFPFSWSYYSIIHQKNLFTLNMELNLRTVLILLRHT